MVLFKDGSKLDSSEDELPIGFSGGGECLVFSSKSDVLAFLSSAASACMAFSGSWMDNMLGGGLL